MKPSAFRILAACLLLAGSCAWPAGARGQSPPPQPAARKFDEFTIGEGGPYHYRYEKAEPEQFKARFARYAEQLRREGARPYAIIYSARVVGWEIYNRSVASSRAYDLWTYLEPAGFDQSQVVWVNGGFREQAATELWVVPPGAQPPCPTPTVRPEDVAYCPQVYVRGGPYVPAPEGPISFKAELHVNDKKVTPTFSWQVSRGQIVRGQGTETIEVELPPGAKGEVVARVEVHGYSLECPTGASAAFAKTTVGVSHFKFDEFGDIRNGDTKARLDNLAIELQSNPTLQVHLVVYGGRLGPLGEAARRAHWLKNYLVSTRGLDPARILTVEGGFRDELSGELWVSPQGSPPPPTRATIDERYVTPKGDVRPKR